MRIALFAGVAFAEVISPTARAEPPPGPLFVALDRVSATNRTGAALSLQFHDDQNSDGGFVDNRLARRLDLDGEIAMTADDGMTANVPLVWNPANFEDHTGLGAVQLGGYHRFRVSKRANLFLRGGLIVPTDDFVSQAGYEQGVAVHGALFPWLEQPPVAGEVFWLRAGAVHRYVHGPFAVQADFLVDAPLTDAYLSGGGLPARFHVGAGIAYLRPPFRLGGELLLSGFPFFQPDKLDREWIDTHFSFIRDVLDSSMLREQTLIGATLSAAVVLGPTDLVAWFSNPLDEGYIRADYHAFGLTFQVGL